MASEELVRRFKHYPPNADKAAVHTSLRADAYLLAAKIERDVPVGREQALAITKIEEAMFWANAGLARAAASE